ncbi:concanavalin A-like lectin/glucanase domain-containing protein [Pseudoneurospora amorphoporcata]|uniref:Concanavalin A-like lectin/glucanase domain-containing protein n=1 Tax=Pseudoneurospora amorphoporcata TaxID=241081 RepID=A0AAN6SEP4_9PEZI|nr:concanavalin A-like lectin/glucanase domain-containing protein [Pseudoneurospora amorphoporcata]
MMLLAMTGNAPRHENACSGHSTKRPFSLFHSLCLLVIALAFSGQVLADCECGYQSDNLDGEYQDVFTDIIETNFARMPDISTNTDWLRQEFNVTRAKARGEYGEMFYVKDDVEYVDKVGNRASDGLQLLVRKDLVDGMVPVAEVDTARLDLSYGTFRASMKLTDIPGTCAAFFWYFNDTQEIDMEFLSKEFDHSKNTYPVNLVLQSRAAAAHGYDASQTDNFIKANLPFDPTADFHEYRIDYNPSEILFYADRVLLAKMNGSNVPSPNSHGHLILSHWSNGNPKWSGGPPKKDAPLVIRYLKAYFNSTDPKRTQDWSDRCKNAKLETSVCKIPVVTRENQIAKDYFFSDYEDKAKNQTVYEPTSGARTFEPVVSWTVIVVLLMVGYAGGYF